MTLQTILCGYIYAGFLTVKTALEAGLLYAKNIISSLDSIVMAIENTIRTSCLEVIDAAIAGYQVLCKYLVDWIMQRTHAQDLLDNFCKSLFKCSYLLTEILNPTSTIAQTLVKNYDYDITGQQKLYDAVASYDSFRQQICSKGFTLVVGLDYLKDKGEDILAQINSWVDIITRNRNRIRKLLESYFYAIEDYGILDLLRKLTAFFNCVLSPSDETCASIATSQNFYKKCLGALHIREIGNGQYKLTDSWVKQKLGMCDNVTMQLNSISYKLSQALVDAGLTSKNVANAQAAYNLAEFIKDTTNAVSSGNYVQIPGVKLVKTAWSGAGEMATALSAVFQKMVNGGYEPKPESDVEFSFDYVINNGRFTNDGHFMLLDVDITEEMFGVNTIDTSTSIQVPISQKSTYEDSLNMIYWSDELKNVVSVGTVVNALVNPTTDDDKKLAEEINAKISVIEDLSDISAIVTKF